MKVPREVGLGYLSLLASAAASRHGQDVVTASRNWIDPVTHHARFVTGEVATTLVESYLPEDVNTVEPARIAEFRERNRTRRVRLNARVQALVEEFERISSARQLGTFKKEIIDVAREEVEKTQNAYRRARIKSVLKVMSVSLAPPAIAATIASMLGTALFTPAAVVSSLTAFAASVLLEREEARATLSNSVWSYLLDLKELQHK